ncbi:MAG: DUF4012 domain-containing protein [Candidatus Promineifilaceae bacterium]
MSKVDAGEAEALVAGTRADIVSLTAALDPFVGVAPILGWLPRVGPLMTNVPAFITMADAGSEAAADLTASLGPALVILRDGSTPESKLPELLDILDEAEPNLIRASAAWDRFETARTQIRAIDTLPWRVREILQRIDANAPAASDALRLAPLLPQLMGAEERRTYLLMAQNEDELRPTGGFISGIGVLVMEDGQIVSLDFADASVIDDWRNKPYDFPPAPLYAFMGAELFLLRDSNFWPDFPRSAEQAIQLYAYGQGIEADGVIAIDQKFVEMLLGALGPVYVSQLDQTIGAENAINQMRAAWEPPEEDVSLGDWMASRKAFMGLLATAIKDQVQHDLGNVDPVALVKTLHQAVQEGHLQVYLREPGASAIFNEIGWDGRQEPPRFGDYLEVVDTSMGFNKVNVMVEREIDYAVVLDRNDRARASLRVAYRHRAPASKESCQHVPDYTLELRYRDLTEGCYWNYVRVYVPGGSQLTGASQHPVPAAAMVTNRGWDGRARQLSDEAEGLTAFANFVLLPPGEELDITFEYTLPPSVIRQDDDLKVYELTIPKQPGTESQAATVVITLPQDASLFEAEPDASSVAGREVTFSLSLRTDQEIAIRYR